MDALIKDTYSIVLGRTLFESFEFYHSRAENLKKVQAKKTREIKIEILLDFHVIFWPILFPDFGFGQGI